MCDTGGEEETLYDLEQRCAALRREIMEVEAELDAPKVSDKCEE